MAAPIPQLDQQTTNTNGYGASLQVTNRGDDLRPPQPARRRRELRWRAARGSARNSAIGGLTPLDRAVRRTRHRHRPGRTARSRRCGSAIAQCLLRRCSSRTRSTLTDSALAPPSPAASTPAQIDLNDQNGGALTGKHCLQPLQPLGRPDLQGRCPAHRLCQLRRGEPRADAGGTVLRESRRARAAWRISSSAIPISSRSSRTRSRPGCAASSNRSEDATLAWNIGYFHTDSRRRHPVRQQPDRRAAPSSRMSARRGGRASMSPLRLTTGRLLA